MSKSRLFIERLVILAGAKRVYDQPFHPGINILRGWNTTGKSTVMDLLVFGLGAELTSWNEHQSKCDWVIVQININGFTLTVKRERTESGKSAMLFFEGTIDESQKDSENWQRFPNRRSDEKHSYSQQLFEMLGLPQHKTDDSKNLTMHQILRLIYVDQLSATEKVLNADLNYDNVTIRRAIGEYLLGLDDLESHNLRQDLISANKEFESFNGELKAIYKMFGNDASLINRQALINDLSDTQKTINELFEKRGSIQRGEEDDIDDQAKNRIAGLQREIDKLNSDITNITSLRHSIRVELIDTQEFLEALEYRKIGLSQSKLINNELGGLTFKYCPSCLSPIDANKSHDSCGLCKTSIKDRERDYAYVQMSNELNFQIRESKILIADFKKQKEELSSKLPALKRKVEIAKEEYSEIVSYSDSRSAIIADISTEIGFYKSQMINIEEKMEMVEKVESLINLKQKAQTKINIIEERLEQIKELNKNRYSSVFESIEKHASELLISDGGNEKNFDYPEDVLIDFSKDRMSVNGRSKYSASSMVVMKNSIRLSVFLHAVDDDLSRLPNILIMDNIEDKGMVPERSQNFQHSLVNACNSLKNEYQVIFTTSMIADDLNNTPNCIGPYYPKGSHTLEF
ncbi:hypothetical protein [Marinomonas sp. ef1]|uniref:hypothetical protein n=1 Tax=Marinomonas sp. ef1 TaxID=2005043 RepID=UPI000C282E61|nr:hypothetical protein [Marinomonas sp. ef1]